jgi:succinylarginine dihydrolase
MTTNLIEVNFDGLVGPTHHYGGLGVGNLASQQNRGLVSNPRAAALQGIEKMRLVQKMADPDRAVQAVLPPQWRPRMDWLRAIGFDGDDTRVLRQAADTSAAAVGTAWSGSAMWTANAATVSPAVDSHDNRLHLTVANLSSSSHRALEATETFATLNQIFAAGDRFVVHPPLPGGWNLRDEGAANHMRLSSQGSGTRGNQNLGIHVFVVGPPRGDAAQRFLPRQSRFASDSIARLHRLDPAGVVFLDQHPAAIDAGAFHNDVVATSHDDLLLYHEQAFADHAAAIDRLQQTFRSRTGGDLRCWCVDANRVPLSDAVASYLFNSQMISDADGSITLVSPIQCEEIGTVRREVERLLAADNPVARVVYVDLRESMRNGGGPACLRLRVPMTAADLRALAGNVIFSDALAAQLVDVIEREYRDHVTVEDLSDLNFAQQAWRTTTKIRQILGLA